MKKLYFTGILAIVLIGCLLSAGCTEEVSDKVITVSGHAVIYQDGDPYYVVYTTEGEIYFVWLDLHVGNRMDRDLAPWMKLGNGGVYTIKMFDGWWGKGICGYTPVDESNATFITFDEVSRMHSGNGNQYEKPVVV
jgi:hypothetical protein